MRPPLAESLDLEAHPEGGWYRRTWTAPERAQLPDGRDRVPAGTWQRTRPGNTDALVTCVVSPEFHFDDFELYPETETA